MSATAETVVEPQWPIVPSKLDVAERCLVIKSQVDKIVADAANHLIIENADQFDDAVVYMDTVKEGAKVIEARRVEYVTRPNEFVKTVNEIVKGYGNELAAARKKVEQIAIIYDTKIKKELADAAAKVRKEQEEEALKRAEKMQAQGNTAGAEQLLDIAASAPKPKAPAKIATTSGIGFSQTVYWKGVVVDKAGLLRSILTGEVLDIKLDDIEVSASALNAFAKARQGSVDTVVFGIKIVKETQGRTR